jgi:hypothetical protein
MSSDGKRIPLFSHALCTLFLASSTAASGKPTSSKRGKRFQLEHSTMISKPLIPITPDEYTLDNIKTPPFRSFDKYILSHPLQQIKRIY